MREHTIAIYCFLDNLLPHIRPVTARKPHTARRLNDV